MANSEDPDGGISTGSALFANQSSEKEIYSYYKL